MQPTAKQPFTVEQLENGVTVFTLESDSRTTVDAFFEAVWDAQKDLPRDSLFRFMVEAKEGGIPPFAYFMEKNRQWVQAHPKLRPNRVAVLIPKSNPFRAFMRSLANVLIHRAINRLEARIFYAEEREQAFEWLLADA